MKTGQRDLFLFGAVGAVAYFAWKTLQKSADAASEPIADAILAATLPGDVTVLGSVVLPTGTRIGMSQLSITPQLRFVYLGKTYQIVRRDGGDYIAVNS